MLEVVVGARNSQKDLNRIETRWNDAQIRHDLYDGE